jgi:hypothetical protein
MSQKQHQLSSLVVEIAKVPYKNGEVDIRYVKTKNGNVFCTALDVAKRLHGEMGQDQARVHLSTIISKLGLAFGDLLEVNISKVSTITHHSAR